MNRKPLALAAILTSALLAPAAAHAAPALSGTFDVTGNPGEITAGPDGNVWFTLDGTSDNKQFGKITPDGTVTEFATPGNITLKGITAGPDGNLWATSINTIVKIPPANPAGATAFNDANIGTPADITTGPDGHLWTGSNGNVIEIPPDNPGNGIGQGDVNHTGIVAGTATGIAAGGDGNLWIADNNSNDSAIVRFNTAGTVLGTPANTGGPLNQTQIVAGPPGQLAFTQPLTTPQRVGRIDFSGNIQFTNMPGGIGDPTGIVFGNDGAYWIANFGVDKLRRLTPDGTLTEPISFDSGSGPRYLAKGPNDTLWVSLEQGKKIARITGVSAPPSPPPPAGGTGPVSTKDTTPPDITGLALSRTTFALGPLLPKFSRKTPVGTTIRFSVSEQSTTTFSFARKAKGFKVGKRCLARPPKGRKARPCTRFIRIKPSLQYPTSAGAHKLRFQGRLTRKKRLRPGRYRLTVVATDAAGNRSKPRTASFRLTK